MDFFLKKLLNKKKIGYVLLDDNNNIIFYNSFFLDYINSDISIDDQSIFTVIPETVGLENIINELILNKRDIFNLDLINRTYKNGQIYYLNLSLLSTEDQTHPVLCLVEDRTDFAELKQKTIQQKNEINLLESLIYSNKKEATHFLIGNSEQITKINHLISKVSKIPSSNILLTGESGTGKNLVARIIHNYSYNNKAPFIEINCAAIPDNLLESELFGYEKGAFTTAGSSKKGLIEEAANGTLFLDEIAELSIKLQSKLLSFLETRRFRRLGSNIEIKVELRLIAATNKDLRELIEQGLFREDLFYRLNVVSLQLPPLRYLNRDIILLSNYFIKKFNQSFNKSIKGLNSDAEKKIMLYHWPGNVRELRNTLERAMLFTESSYISADDILLHTETKKNKNNFRIPAGGLSITLLEKELIEEALKISNGNISKAAKLLGLSRDTLRYRIIKHQIIIG